MSHPPQKSPGFSPGEDVNEQFVDEQAEAAELVR